MAGFNYAQNIIGIKKGANDIHELEVEVANLSTSVLEIKGDVQEIALDISQLSASTLPYSAEQSTKQKIDEIVNDFIVLDDTDFTWNNDAKRFSKNISLSGYKAIIVNATNGTAIMGAFYSSQNNTLYVCGFIPVDGTSIGDTYHFKVLIIK